MEGFFGANSLLDGFEVQVITSPAPEYGSTSPVDGYVMGLAAAASLDPNLCTYTGGTSNYSADVPITFVLMTCVVSTVLILQMPCVRNDAILFGGIHVFVC
jgi:hypothetical protein